MIDDTTNALRHEIKMSCDEVFLHQVHAWVRLHPAGFVTTYPPRQVNSVYLDTLDADSLSDHLNGSGRRSKLRFRWYGTDHTAAQGALELKCKSSRVGWKETYPIPVTFDLTVISWSEWVAQLRAHATGNAAGWLAARDQPTLLGSYVRAYYETLDAQIRLTIDSEQRFYPQIACSTPNLTRSIPPEHHIVIEVKFEAHLYRRASDVLSSFPLPAERNSKYVNGLIPL